jgi:ribosomal protein S18 acetylase RimI-like enzyme
MRRKIVGFHQDQRQEWVADLECGHTMHVRHNPPFQDRAWVQTAEGRQTYIGVPVECSACQITLRHAEPRDFYFVTSVINEWWGGRNMRDMLPKLFFVHFRETSFIAEIDGHIVGFLNGFFSQTFSDEAYIHFVGVHPADRQAGVARALYEKFFAVTRAHGRRVVRCVTSPINKTSIAFHLRMGFEIEPGDVMVNGVSAHSNYDGKGESRVLFVKRWETGD